NIHETGVDTLLLLVGVEIDRRHGSNEVADLVGMQGSVAQRQQPALTDAKQGYRGKCMAFANDVDEAIQIAIDEVPEIIELIGERGMAPICHVYLATGIHQVAQE